MSAQNNNLDEAREFRSKAADCMQLCNFPYALKKRAKAKHHLSANFEKWLSTTMLR